MSLPPALEGLFRNYVTETIDLDRHRDLIVKTVLARGAWDQVIWVFDHYGAEAVGDVFRKDYFGLRTLPRPTLCLWELLFIEPDARHRSATTDPVGRWRPTRIPPSSTDHPQP